MSWRDVRVDVPCGTDRTRRRALEGRERLAALYRLQNGERPSDVRFANVLDARDVDWDGFPMIAALEAVTGEEVRRLQELGAGGVQSSRAN